MPELSFDAGTSQRVDVWLWCVRAFKTRSLAQKQIKSGHVRIDGDRAKPSDKVKIGQVVVIRRPGAERVLTVQGFLDTRGPASMAAACYIDTSPPPNPLLRTPVPKREKGAGRPTKKDRRAWDRLRGRTSR